MRVVGVVGVAVCLWSLGVFAGLLIIGLLDLDYLSVTAMVAHGHHAPCGSTGMSTRTPHRPFPFRCGSGFAGREYSLAFCCPTVLLSMTWR
jgi:hypothetical protein